MKPLLSIALVVCLTGCDMQNKKAKKTDCDITNETEFKFVKNNKADILEWRKGLHRMLLYRKQGEVFNDVENYEDNYEEVLAFKIHNEWTEFEFKDEELSKINCLYGRVIYGKKFVKDTIHINKGIIKGKVTSRDSDSEEWEIEVEVESDSDFGRGLHPKDGKIKFKSTITAIPSYKE